MPEGPEVRRVVDYLQVCNGKFLQDIQILTGRYVRHGPFVGYYDLLKTIPLKVLTVSCQGKFIYFYFENDASLWCTLGMSGAWLNHQTKHSRVKLSFSGADVYFDDVRNFGTLKYVRDKELLTKKLKTLGHDPLANNIECTMLQKRLVRKGAKTIAEVLMDQSVIAGIGNYLKAEILYAAKISPHRLCSSLSEKDIFKICKYTNNIMRTSYESGGATILTYKDENGDPGTFSRRFMVYNQKHDPLGNPVIRETTRDKRTTHWVPNIQI